MEARTRNLSATEREGRDSRGRRHLRSHQLPLTAKQLQILVVTGQLIRERGLSPTVAELTRKFELHSKNGMNDHLRRLEAKGYLVREPFTARSIMLTNLGWGVVNKQAASPRDRGKRPGPR